MFKEILYKNLSSMDRKRRVFSSCVVNRADSYTAKTERKYVYLIKKVMAQEHQDPKTQVFLRNERNSSSAKQQFSCSLKGGFYVTCAHSLFLVRYLHSLKINLQGQSVNPA